MPVLPSALSKSYPSLLARVVFYQKTRQRVRVPVNSALVAEAEEAVARAWDLATYGDIPPPLVESRKQAIARLSVALGIITPPPK